MVRQYNIYWVNLDPTIGSEIKKTRPCIILSPDVVNKHLNTVLIAPLTSTVRKFPMRLDVQVAHKKGQIALDQIRCIDKIRLQQSISSLSKSKTIALKRLLKEYLID